MGEDWARMFEPEGAGGYSGYGGEEERRQETKVNEEEIKQANIQSGIDAKNDKAESLRKDY